MALHIDFEAAEPYKLIRADVVDERARKAGFGPKPILRAAKEAGRIVLDSETTLTGVPAEAWEYMLGDRSALEWVLDQHKEKVPRDLTVRDNFNSYRFANYKEKVVELIMRVTTVSVETQRVVEAMARVSR